MIGENGTPETPDWAPPSPKCCPFDRGCQVCESEQQSIWRHLPASIELGEN